MRDRLYKEEESDHPFLGGLDPGSFSREGSNWLERYVNEEEVKKAIWARSGDKAPSPGCLSVVSSTDVGIMLGVMCEGF